MKGEEFPLANDRVQFSVDLRVMAEPRTVLHGDQHASMPCAVINICFSRLLLNLPLNLMGIF